MTVMSANTVRCDGCGRTACRTSAVPATALSPIREAAAEQLRWRYDTARDRDLCGGCAALVDAEAALHENIRAGFGVPLAIFGTAVWKADPRTRVRHLVHLNTALCRPLEVPEWWPSHIARDTCSTCAALEPANDPPASAGEDN